MMGVRITDTRNVALYCSTTGTAFGPVFESTEDAEQFLLFLHAIGDTDARKLTPAELLTRFTMWKGDRKFVGFAEGTSDA